jgi:hypothetical protein
MGRLCVDLGNIPQSFSGWGDIFPQGAVDAGLIPLTFGHMGLN